MNKAFKKIRKFDFENSTAHLWIFKTSTTDIRYRAFYVQTDTSLTNQLKDVVVREIVRISEHSPYTCISQTNENSCLSIKQDDTAFSYLKTQVDKIENEHSVSGIKDLKNAKGYVVKFTKNNKTVYAVKRSTATWKTSYPKKFINMVFSNGELTAVEDNSFSIEKTFDFYVYNGSIFVANKRGFESTMQHKTAYKKAFSDLQLNPSFCNLFSDLEPLKNYVGSNSIQLRRMSTIEEKGIYNLPNFIPNLKAVNSQRNWGINIDDNTNKIVPCENTVKIIMQVLLDHRLMSQITENVYDVPDAVQV